MKHSDIPEGENNGDIEREDDRSCPFYHLGTADFHNFVKAFEQHNEIFSKLIDKATDDKKVPIKTHLLTIAILIGAFFGTKIFIELVEHIHKGIF